MKPAIRIILPIGAAVALGALVVSLIFNGNSEPSIVVASPAEVTSVIEDLGPGDTLRMVTLRYKATTAKEASCSAGWTRHESLETFDMDGALLSSRTEARTEDGALCSVAELLNGELIFTSAEGDVFHRVTDEDLKPPTVETKRAAVRLAQALVFEDLAAQSEASETLGNEQVVVWEELDGDVMQRHTVLPDVGFEVQTETLVDGQLVESTLYEVYEVVSVR